MKDCESENTSLRVNKFTVAYWQELADNNEETVRQCRKSIIMKQNIISVCNERVTRYLKIADAIATYQIDTDIANGVTPELLEAGNED